MSLVWFPFNLWQIAPHVHAETTVVRERKSHSQVLGLSQNAFDRIGVLHPGKALLEALERKSEAVVVDAEAMHDGGVDLV